MQEWFVIHTQPSKESTAEKHLNEQKFEVYIPRYSRLRSHARKTEKILAPLFPRYIFVRIDLEKDQWRAINGTRGVSYVLMQGEQPAKIPSFIIEDLKQQEDPQGLLNLVNLSNFTKGNTVRISEGAFEGQQATIEHLDDNQRIHLLLNFLGRETKIILPIHNVEAN